jgi:hypothetical protein
MPSTPFDQFEFDDQPEYATPSRPPATPANTAKRVIVTIIWLIATVLIIAVGVSCLSDCLRLLRIQEKYNGDVTFAMIADKHLPAGELKQVREGRQSIVVYHAVYFGITSAAVLFVGIVLTVVASIFMSDGKARYRRAW